MTEFINPYNFIPFPNQVIRRVPPRHDPTFEEAKSLYTGWFMIEWTLRSPMAVPVDEWGPIEGEIRVPGSSVKGAIRSVHEALFGGCLRAVDLGFRPVYRDLATATVNEGWRMGLVVGSDERGRAKVRLCKEIEDPSGLKPLRIESRILTGHYGPGMPQTGDVISFNQSDVTQPTEPAAEDYDRYKIQAVTGHRRPKRLADYKAGDAILLVTDRPENNRQKCHWSVGVLTDWVLSVGKAAAIEYAWAIDNARETAKVADKVVPHDGVMPQDVPHYRTRHGGIRRSAGRELAPGDVIWVQTGSEGPDDDEVGSSPENVVTAIRHGQLWRTRATGRSLVDRLPSTTLHGCLTGDNADGGGVEPLCLSCTLFGAADTEGDKERTGTHRAYAGHVRFGPAVHRLGGPKPEPSRLAPLSEPHVGAGIFYLEPEGADVAQQQARRGEPNTAADRLSRWNSGERADNRRLRGRKFYWASSPQEQLDKLTSTGGYPGQRLRYQKGPNHSAEATATPALILTKGRKLTQKVWFDGIDEVGLRTLLATFQPHLLFGGEPVSYALHLGRGKPLGLGSVTAAIDLREMHIETLHARYGTPEDATPRLDLASQQATEEQALDRCGDDLRDRVWPAAKKLLSIDALGDDAWLVSYPTDRPWSEFDGAEFGKSFNWFRSNNGPAESKKDANGRRRIMWKPDALQDLPQATAPSQRMRKRKA